MDELRAAIVKLRDEEIRQARNHPSSQWIWGEHMKAASAYDKVLKLLAAQPSASYEASGAAGVIGPATAAPAEHDWHGRTPDGVWHGCSEHPDPLPAAPALEAMAGASFDTWWMDWAFKHSSNGKSRYTLGEAVRAAWNAALALPDPGQRVDQGPTKPLRHATPPPSARHPRIEPESATTTDVGVRELVAKWRAENSTDSERHADELEAALAQKEPGAV